MWKTDNGFQIKTMRYNNSCYPCCIQVALTNLRTCGQTDEIEDLWQDMHRAKGLDLEEDAPTYDQIAEYVGHTPFKDGSEGHLWLEASLNEDRAAVLNAMIEKNFFNPAGPRALIIGVGHAQLIYKLSDGRYIHFEPSPDENRIKAVFYDSIGIKLQTATDNSGDCQLQFCGPDGKMLSDSYRAATTHALIFN